MTVAKETSCVAAGNEAYKQCSVCEKYFAADAAVDSTEGRDGADDFEIAQLAHSYTGEIKNDGNGQEGTHSYKCVNGCNEYGAAEKHTWNEGIVTTKPDCLTAGEKTYTCTVANCGATYIEELDKDSSQHGGVAVVVGDKEATCSTNGYTGDIYCECSELVGYGMVIAATGNHRYIPDKVQWNDDQLACTIRGICYFCQETVTAHATITSKVSVDADCMTEMVTTYTAIFTEHWITEKNIMLAIVGEKNPAKHTRNNSVKDFAEATCGVAGYSGDVYCECGEKIAVGTVIPATGEHKYTEEISCTEATCMATGSTTTKCACGAEMIETLPIDVENHVNERIFESLGDEVHSVACACGQVISSSENHTFDPNSNQCVCGEVMSKSTNVTVVVVWVIGALGASGLVFSFLYIKRRKSQK